MVNSSAMWQQAAHTTHQLASRTTHQLASRTTHQLASRTTHQLASRTTHQLASPSCSTRARQKQHTKNTILLVLRTVREFSGKKVRRLDHQEKSDKTERNSKWSRQKNKSRDRKGESNDSPEIMNRSEG